MDRNESLVGPSIRDGIRNRMEYTKMIVSIVNDDRPIWAVYEADLSSATARALLLERAIIANGFKNLLVRITKVD